MKLGSRVLRASVSVGLLLGLVWWLDVGVVVSRLSEMRLEWVLLAIAISVAQVAVLAWRWRFTAGRLGVALAFSAAWREYYLSIFLNQVLPGGVLGDVSRGWRHVRAQTHFAAPGGPAMRAVIVERLSAQGVMTAVAVVSLLVLPMTLESGSWRGVFAAGIAAVLLVVATLIWIRQSFSSSLPARVLADLGEAHQFGLAFVAQVASAALVVGTYLTTYLAAARAVGVEIPLPVFLPLVAPVLMTMLIPVTVAGWGLREGAAAVLWEAVGLTAADGIVVSVAYGLLVLLCSLPGGVVLLLRPRRP